MAPKWGKPRPSVTIKPHTGLECKVPPVPVLGLSSAGTASFFREVNESMSNPEAARMRRMDEAERAQVAQLLGLKSRSQA